MEDKTQHKLHNFLIKEMLSNSPYLRNCTAITPDIAYAQFRKNFRVVEKNGKSVIIGLYNGGKLYSDDRPGQLASTEEIIKILMLKFLEDRLIYTTTPSKYTYDFSTVHELPCDGKFVNFGSYKKHLPINEQFVYYENGAISDEFLSLCDSLAPNMGEQLQLAILNKNMDFIEEVQQKLYMIADKLFIAQRQLSYSNTYHLDELYTATSGPDKIGKRYIPVLCRICIENRENKCQWLLEAQTEWEVNRSNKSDIDAFKEFYNKGV